MVVAGKSRLHRPATVGEANDATNLDLTGVQADLIDAMAATGTQLVVVVLSESVSRSCSHPAQGRVGA